jgi:hypothetical protein
VSVRIAVVVRVVVIVVFMFHEMNDPSAAQNSAGATIEGIAPQPTTP